jgi:hypothetical protein
VRTLCEAEHSGALVDFHGAFFNKETSQIAVVLVSCTAELLRRSRLLTRPYGC